MQPLLSEPLFEWSYLLNQAVNLILLVAIQYGNGLLVIHKNVKVNYTRKINHFLLFFIPIFVNRGYAYEETVGLFILGAVLAVAKFVFYTRPFRERFNIIKVMFSSFDRPEDRPHTLLWLVTQMTVGYLVLLPMGILFATFDLMHLILIPIIIYGIGDGLAEPVGVRFGKNRYPVYALFSANKYYRTIEGSAAVFIVSVLVIIAYQQYFSAMQLALALLIIPLLMTLVEALSPHTWDAPAMFFAGYIALFAVVLI